MRVPTLILHGSEDTIVPVDVARYVASQIPTGRVVEIPGVGHLAFGNPAAALIGDELERFLKDVWEAGGWEEAEPERVLATVLFTDIVGSTAKAMELGDRAWRELLERHHAVIRRELVRFRGAELDVAGDGWLGLRFRERGTVSLERRSRRMATVRRFTRGLGADAGKPAVTKTLQPVVAH